MDLYCRAPRGNVLEKRYGEVIKLPSEKFGEISHHFAMTLPIPPEQGFQLTAKYVVHP